MSAVAPDAVAALVTCHREPPARALLAGVLRVLPRVLVVDDAMPASRARALDRVAADLGVAVLHLPRRSGKGTAIETGLRRLRGADPPIRGVMVLDGDGQHPPGRIPAFLAASAGADLVIGDRFGTPGDIPLVRRAANRIANQVVTRASGVPVRDSQCGMRMLSGRALDEVTFPRRRVRGGDTAPAALPPGRDPARLGADPRDLRRAAERVPPRARQRRGAVGGFARRGGVGCWRSTPGAETSRA